MLALPQNGGCLCGDVRFSLRDDPLTVYACHCSDCQTETGSSCVVSVVARQASVEWQGTRPEPFGVELPDGRSKILRRCPRCLGPIGSVERPDGLVSIDGGVFDDTSWIVPAGHIWTRSAQPWVRIPEDAVRHEAQPTQDEFVELVRAWRNRE